jgi:glycine dehydrogenase subunit 1
MQYISNTEEQKKEMLQTIGAPTFEHLIAQVPRSLRDFRMDIPAGVSELELFRELVEVGKQNSHFHDHACYLGAGNYDHFIPTVVNHMVHRGEFITSYTPYQGEASQGTLQFIYEFQSLICELTAMDHSNASMYDGASSLAEAALLAIRSSGRNKILIPQTVHPEHRAVVRTYTSALHAEIVEVPMKDTATDLEALKKQLGPDVAAVVVQQPNFFGVLEDVKAVTEAAHAAGALLISSVNPISLGVIAPPGEYGADICVGEGQPLGNAASFGGPHFGIFAVKADLLRKVPGRIAGMTVDKKGRRAFVLTLQAREQHIRREKATSNICTNHSLCALKATIYLSLLGKKGLKKLALINLKKAHDTRERLLKIPGVQGLSSRPFFNEFAITIDRDARSLKESLRKNRVLGPLALEGFYPGMKGAYLVAVTENRTDGDLERLVRAIEEAKR